MPGFDPHMLLQMLSRMQQGGGQMPQQPQGFGFTPSPPQVPQYTPPQIDQTPGIYNQAAQGRASQPLMPIGGDKGPQMGIPRVDSDPSKASQWASQSLFGAQPMANGQQAGLGQAGLASILKLLGL